MLLAAGHSWRPEAGFARWGVAVATILLLHAGAALGAMIRWESTEPPAPPPAAIMLELAPLPVAPPAPQTMAPQEPPPAPEPETGPERVVDFSQVLPPLPELPLTPPDIPVPEVELPKPQPEKKVEQPKERPKEQAKEKPKKQPKNEVAEKPKQEPKPKPEPAVAQKPTPQPAQQQQAAAAAPVQAAKAPAAPSAADVARRAAAEANWQGLLLAHLEQHKKYPRLAQKRRQEGTAYLRFRMDRSGQVLNFALARSAGHDALDKEVLAMIKRAEPLPALPPEVTDSQMDIVVPVQFMLR